MKLSWSSGRSVEDDPRSDTILGLTPLEFGTQSKAVRGPVSRNKPNGRAQLLLCEMYRELIARPLLRSRSNSMADGDGVTAKRRRFMNFDAATDDYCNDKKRQLDKQI